MSVMQNNKVTIIEVYLLKNHISTINKLKLKNFQEKKEKIFKLYWNKSLQRKQNYRIKPLFLYWTKIML